MISLKSKSVAPVTFADAAQLHANGYAPVMAYWGQPTPYGPWGTYHFREGDDKTYGNEAVAILTDSRPVIGAVAAGACKATWLAALRVQVFGDKGLAKAVDDLVTSRLQWRNVGTTLSPVRIDNTQRSTIRIFALADSDYSPFMPPPSRWLGYVMPTDPPPNKRYLVDYRANSVSWTSAAEMFVVSADTEGRPYEWTDGGLLAVPRSALPVIDAACAADLQADIERLMQERGGEPWI
jgi:hypothetical protein